MSETLRAARTDEEPEDVIASLSAALTAAINQPRTDAPPAAAPLTVPPVEAPRTFRTRLRLKVLHMPPPASGVPDAAAFVPTPEPAEALLPADAEPKRKRGRPPKPKPAEPLPKRPRGRPRKGEG